MDNDLMDRWAACVFGVDCETHRAALDEIQRLRDDLAAAYAESEDVDEVKGRLDAARSERDGLQKMLGTERKWSAELLRRIGAIIDFAQEKAA